MLVALFMPFFIYISKFESVVIQFLCHVNSNKVFDFAIHQFVQEWHPNIGSSLAEIEFADVHQLPYGLGGVLVDVQYQSDVRSHYRVGVTLAVILLSFRQNSL